MIQKFSIISSFISKNMLHKEIITKEQVELLPLVKSFSQDFGLVGGTAIALHIGHRRSIDFDLFTKKEFDNLDIRQKITKFAKIERVITDQKDQYTVMVNGVRLTFLRYPYLISFTESFENVIKIPDLLTLAAMKAHTLGRRVKWKDYIDLYFIMKNYCNFEKVVYKAKKIFTSEFNEKLFRVQLSYFKDLDYTEEVIYMKGFETKNDIIKKFLIEKALI